MSGQCMQPNITSLPGSEQPKSCQDHLLTSSVQGSCFAAPTVWAEEAQRPAVERQQQQQQQQGTAAHTQAHNKQRHHARLMVGTVLPVPARSC